VLFSLFEKYPNNSILHCKIEEIIKYSLKLGGDEIVEEIMYKAQLIKHILELTQTDKCTFVYENTENMTTHGFFAHIINISNELLKQAKDEPEISNTLESIPEWVKFQEGRLKECNDVLEGPLGGRDPRTKIESLFDDNDFLGRFKGFKPVPFDSLKNRRKNMNGKPDSETELETEEEEEEDDKLEFDDIDQYYEDNDEIIEVDPSNEPDFAKTDDELDEIIASNNDRYNTIDLEDDDVELDDDEYEDDEDDVNQKDLHWKIDPVGKEHDDEKLIDDNLADVAMEFIMGSHRQRRGHKKNQECMIETNKRKDFDPDDDLISAFFKEKDEKDMENEGNELNSDLKDIRDYEDDSPVNIMVDDDQDTESDQFYDNTYWSNPYSGNFKIEDLLQE
jgi:hypothetical protein